MFIKKQFDKSWDFLPVKQLPEWRVTAVAGEYAEIW